jgi:vacuolar-type H+-ATPase subunit E/Vma4
MGMTRRESLAKQEIRKVLSKNGYPTYSYLIQDFYIHLTKDPNVIGYMNPGKGIITLNENLDIEQVSVIVRHEILHEFFNHAQRFIEHVGEEEYLKRDATIHNMMNIAGDYDISNRGYTEEDKKNIRQIRLDGKLLKGLVTEDDHPDWVNLSLSQMYDKLVDEMNKEKEEFQKELEERFKDHTEEYIEIYNKIIDKYRDVSDDELAKAIDKFNKGEEVL